MSSRGFRTLCNKTIVGWAGGVGRFVSPRIIDNAKWAGARVMYCKGAFDDSLRRIARGTDAVTLQLRHDPSAVLCSTADGSLTVTKSGNEFCFTVRPINAAGRTAAFAFSMHPELREASIGADSQEFIDCVVDGTPVVMVTKAALTEISLVEQGAWKGSFVGAMAIRETTTRPPRQTRRYDHRPQGLTSDGRMPLCTAVAPRLRAVG